MAWKSLKSESGRKTPETGRLEGELCNDYMHVSGEIFTACVACVVLTLFQFARYGYGITK